MIRIFTDSNPLTVFNLRNLLEHQNIKCIVRNDGLHSAAGELPPTDLWPEIWIENEQDIENAKQIIADAIEGDKKATSWFCYNCSETNEPAFEICWKCAQLRD